MVRKIYHVEKIFILPAGFARRGIVLDFKDKAKKLLAEKGYDPDYGARPLKRVIQSEILDPLSMKIVSGELVEGQKVSISSDGDSITIGRKKKEGASSLDRTSLPCISI